MNGKERTQRILNRQHVDRVGTVSYTHLDVYKRQAIIGLYNSAAVCICGNNVGYFVGTGGVHENDFLKTNAHYIANVKYKHCDNGRDNAWKGDVAHLLKTVCPIHARAVIQRHVNIGKRGQINNGVPPEGLPDVAEHVKEAEVFRLRHEVNGILAGNGGVEIVDNARCGGKEIGHQSNNDDNRNKVRHVTGSLNQLFYL